MNNSQWWCQQEEEEGGEDQMRPTPLLGQHKGTRKDGSKVALAAIAGNAMVSILASLSLFLIFGRAHEIVMRLLNLWHT